MNDSINHYFNSDWKYTLSDFNIPGELTDELYKCRVLYDPEIISIEFQKYTKKQIHWIKLVTMDELDYRYKSTDRAHFKRLFNHYPGFDDFIIVKNNKLTDSTYANLVLYDGKEWHTPSNYLLAGTKRSFLLKAGKIREKEISADQLSHYQKVCLINAMLDLGDIEVETASIEF
ncbi:MAG: aminotransferase class IV [Bacteroidales bacterium]